MTLFVGLLLPTVIGLGVWQLQRAQDKAGYQERFVARTSALPVAPPAQVHADNDVAFLRVRLVGEFETQRYFLVDNQVADGRPGYWVVASFRGQDGRRWLVNRGWIAAPAQREELPAVPAPLGPVTTIGAFWPNTGLVPLLAEDPWEGALPLRVQRLDVARMAGLLDNAAPHEIRLEAGQPGSLKMPSLNPGFAADRHRGYALQWFGLGAVLLVGFAVFGFKR